MAFTRIEKFDKNRIREIGVKIAIQYGLTGKKVLAEYFAGQTRKANSLHTSTSDNLLEMFKFAQTATIEEPAEQVDNKTENINLTKYGGPDWNASSYQPIASIMQQAQRFSPIQRKALFEKWLSKDSNAQLIYGLIFAQARAKALALARSERMNKGYGGNIQDAESSEMYDAIYGRLVDTWIDPEKIVTVLSNWNPELTKNPVQYLLGHIQGDTGNKQKQVNHQVKEKEALEQSLDQTINNNSHNDDSGIEGYDVVEDKRTHENTRITKNLENELTAIEDWWYNGDDQVLLSEVPIIKRDLQEQGLDYVPMGYTSKIAKYYQALASQYNSYSSIPYETDYTIRPNTTRPNSNEQNNTATEETTRPEQGLGLTDVVMPGAELDAGKKQTKKGRPRIHEPKKETISPQELVEKMNTLEQDDHSVLIPHLWKNIQFTENTKDQNQKALFQGGSGILPWKWGRRFLQSPEDIASLNWEDDPERPDTVRSDRVRVLKYATSLMLFITDKYKLDRSYKVNTEEAQDYKTATIAQAYEAWKTAVKEMIAKDNRIAEENKSYFYGEIDNVTLSNFDKWVGEFEMSFPYAAADYGRHSEPDFYNESGQPKKWVQFTEEDINKLAEYVVNRFYPETSKRIFRALRGDLMKVSKLNLMNQEQKINYVVEMLQKLIEKEEILEQRREKPSYRPLGQVIPSGKVNYPTDYSLWHEEGKKRKLQRTEEQPNAFESDLEENKVAYRMQTLIRVANLLEGNGYYKEADIIDRLIGD